MKQNLWIQVGTFSALALLACGKKGGRPTHSRDVAEDPPGPQNEALQLTGELKSFESCAAAEAYVQDFQVKLMQKQILDQMRWRREGASGQVDSKTEAAPQAAPMSSRGEASGPSGHTGTNNQVTGVEEGDLAKNDGRHLFVATGNRVNISRIWPVESMALASSIVLENNVRSLLTIEENGVAVRLLVLSEASPYLMDGGRSTFVPREGWSLYATLTTFDVSNPASPQKISEKNFPGSVNTVRQIGGKVLLVTSDSLTVPKDVQSWIVAESELSNEQFDQRAREQMAANEKIIRSTPLAQWLSHGTDVTLAETIDLQTCANLQRSAAPTPMGLTHLYTIQASSGEHTTQSLLAYSNQVYANARSLYLTTGHWWWWNSDGNQSATYLHKFNLNERGAAYSGSGAVKGDLVNSFALDEDADGYLRVATTITHWQRQPDARANEWWRVNVTTENRVFVLAPQEGRLAVIGATPPLAEGERIMSARFVGKKGYLVTFRNIDPLFTLDLSQPAQPRRVGELKVPGFSSYIHPVNDNTLLTVGTHIDPENPDWWNATPQVSLFDVSQFSNPRLAHSVKIDDLRNAYSNAQWDHRAFTFFAERKLLAIPMAGYKADCTSANWWQDCTVSRLDLYRVDAERGIAKLGALNMSDIERTHRWDWGTWVSKAWVFRSVLSFGNIDGAEKDVVYAISDMGARAALVESPASPLATVPFPVPDQRIPGE